MSPRIVLENSIVACATSNICEFCLQVNLTTSAVVLLIPLLVDCKFHIRLWCRSVRSLSQPFCVAARPRDQTVPRLKWLGYRHVIRLSLWSRRSRSVAVWWSSLLVGTVPYTLFEIFRNLFNSSLLLENMVWIRPDSTIIFVLANWMYAETRFWLRVWFIGLVHLFSGPSQ